MELKGHRPLLPKGSLYITMKRVRNGGGMMARKQVAMSIRVMLVAVMVVFGVAGCANMKGATSSDSSGGGSAAEAGPVPQYYDFGDILVPAELELDKDNSFVFRTPGLAAGVLVLKGNVEVSSLITFFDTNMAKDNWQPVTSFKSQRTIMMFKKDNRWAVVNITDKDFSTSVEIWVAPTMGTEMGDTGGLMK
jgi:hypothetical protein